MLVDSKTTFVTVNLKSVEVTYNSKTHSKTTFVTVNPIILHLIFYLIYNSKTTFVTVNHNSNAIFSFKILLFKNNVCYC